jgi:hypothetical protein
LIIVAVVQHDLILFLKPADRFVTGHHLSLQMASVFVPIETDTDSVWVAKPLKVPLIGVHSLKLRPTESFT